MIGYPSHSTYSDEAPGVAGVHPSCLNHASIIALALWPLVIESSRRGIPKSITLRHSRRVRGPSRESLTSHGDRPGADKF